MVSRKEYKGQCLRRDREANSSCVLDSGSRCGGKEHRGRGKEARQEGKGIHRIFLSENSLGTTRTFVSSDPHTQD